MVTRPEIHGDRAWWTTRSRKIEARCDGFTADRDRKWSFLHRAARPLRQWRWREIFECVTIRSLLILRKPTPDFNTGNALKPFDGFGRWAKSEISLDSMFSVTTRIHPSSFVLLNWLVRSEPRRFINSETKRPKTKMVKVVHNGWRQQLTYTWNIK
jgi:hypothetical protein